MSATETLLIDLFSEEIPARMQRAAANDLAKSMADTLKAEGLSVGAVDVWYAPRHIALRIADIPTSQADRSEERRGPREGAPEQAVAGFLSANGLESLDQAEMRETPKGNFYFAVQHIKGQQTLDLLPALIEKSIRDFTWPKSMRWGRGSFRWVRPLHRVVALFGDAVVPGQLDLGGGASIAFGRETEGHRFSGAGAIALTNPATFEDQLRDGSVVIDPAERADAILAGARKAAQEVDCTLIEDVGLLNEVTGLVEWPTIVRGQIPDRFMAVPKEVLVLSMKEHQKYFALQQPDGTLAPYFITVADGQREAETFARIAGGNERVLAARLSDAEFFWNQDRKEPLENRVPALSSIVFHAKLGTVGDRIDRMAPMAAWLSSHIDGADRDAARSAARLSKADLTTGMVGEFPELQGVMGAYYATHDGEDAAVAQAISEHYSPLGPNDDCPSAPLSIAVALADKIDSLVGFWRIDEKPTGSKDPFALRRAALGLALRRWHVGLRRLTHARGLRRATRATLCWPRSSTRGGPSRHPPVQPHAFAPAPAAHTPRPASGEPLGVAQYASEARRRDRKVLLAAIEKDGSALCGLRSPPHRSTSHRHRPRHRPPHSRAPPLRPPRRIYLSAPAPWRSRPRGAGT